MPTQVQFRRGNTAQVAAFTGAPGEIVIDTDRKIVVVQDGVKSGGYPMAPNNAFDTANAAFARSNTAFTQSLLLALAF